MINVWFPGVAWLLFSGALLTVGLRGLVTKQPLLFSARWHFAFLLLAVSPSIIPPLRRLLTGRYGPMGPFDVLGPLCFLVMLVSSWVERRGYVTYGVTEDSFRNALNDALEALHLPYEETRSRAGLTSLTRSRIRLTSLGADLQVSFEASLGTGDLQIKPARFGLTLDRIAAGMKANLETSPAQTNTTWFVFLLVAGVVMAGLTLGVIAG